MRKVSPGSLAVLSLVFVAACGEVKPAEPDARPIDAPIDTPPGMAMLSIDRNSADVGSVLVGQASAPAMFTVTNSGTAATGVLAVQISGSGWAITSNGCAGMTLAAGADCDLAVALTPGAVGTASGMLTVNASPGGSVSATLTGTGIPPGALTAMPPSINFGMVAGGTTSATQTITVRNTGGAPSGAIAVALGGADTGEFEIVTPGCLNMMLAPNATCTIDVRMRPGAASTGAKTAMITASATPGGMAITQLMGTVQRPAVIALGGGSGAFGNVVIGQTAVQTITVTNTGQQATGVLTVARSGSATFSVLTGMATDCVSGTTTLAGGAMCNVRVQFAPSAAGAATGTLMVSGTPGGSAMLALTGNGQRPAALTGNANPAPTFGLVEVNVTSATTSTWTIMNTGDVASSVPTTTPSSAEIVITNNTCTAAIPAGGTCSMMVAFKPSMGGARTATITVAVTGSSVMLSASATGGFRITLTRNGASGSVASNPAGLTCAPPAASCFGVFAPGNVVLTATTTNGAGYYFSSWAGADAGTCAGEPTRTCTLAVNAAEAVTANFTAITTNLVFVSSTSHATNLGGTAPYDTICNQLATAAGINNAAGTNFSAWISDANSNALARLGNATGWVRMDGRVFASTRIGLLNGQIFNAVRFTETGVDAGDAEVLTGTNEDGTTSANQNCSNWTTTAGTANIMTGASMGGPSFWSGNSSRLCSAQTYRVLCMMKTSSAVPMVTTLTGKKMWLSSTTYTVAAGGNPDNVCNAVRPAGVASGRALIARTTASAASLLTAAQLYVRPDGQEIGTGAEFVANTHNGGVWQAADGTYLQPELAWIGSSIIGNPGTAATTCNNWVDSAGTGAVNFPQFLRRWGIGISAQACATARRVYCYEP